MSSAIRCISCTQKINLAPGTSGIVVCPMCKTQQPVPQEQGQHAPILDKPGKPSSPTPEINNGRTILREDHRSQHAQIGNEDRQATRDREFESGGGCGCLLVGILVGFSAWPAIADAFR